jgi:antitoxin component YwqK of YwqJK toxin-antitoxin module
LISKKYWYENGNIAFSAELPNHYKVFYEDGKIKAELIGTIAEENGDFKIKDGVYNEYDQNGKVTYTEKYKDFQRVSEN